MGPAANSSGYNLRSRADQMDTEDGDECLQEASSDSEDERPEKQELPLGLVKELIRRRADQIKPYVLLYPTDWPDRIPRPWRSIKTTIERYGKTMGVKFSAMAIRGKLGTLQRLFLTTPEALWSDEVRCFAKHLGPQTLAHAGLLKTPEEPKERELEDDDHEPFVQEMEESAAREESDRQASAAAPSPPPRERSPAIAPEVLPPVTRSPVNTPPSRDFFSDLASIPATTSTAATQPATIQPATIQPDPLQAALDTAFAAPDATWGEMEQSLARLTETAEALLQSQVKFQQTLTDMGESMIRFGEILVSHTQAMHQFVEVQAGDQCRLDTVMEEITTRIQGALQQHQVRNRQEARLVRPSERVWRYQQLRTDARFLHPPPAAGL